MTNDTSPTDETTPERPFDLFELITALILGLAAVGGAWAGYQGSLWAGNQATSFSVANHLMTKAARKVTQAEAFYGEAVQHVNQDRMVFLTLRGLYIDAVLLDGEAGRELERAGAMLKVKYILTHELSEEAYSFLELPDGLHRSDDWNTLTDAQAEAAAESHLDDDYFESHLDGYAVELAAGEAFRSQADARFLTGRRENFNGDLFTFTGVLFTVCLFLAGIGLVFKTRIRWAFASGAALVLVLGLVDLQRNPWTEPTHIADEELNSAKAAASTAAAKASAIASDDEPAAGEASATEPADEPAPAATSSASQP